MISIVRVLTDGWTDGNGPNIIFEKDSFTEIFEWMRFVSLAASPQDGGTVQRSML